MTNPRPQPVVKLLARHRAAGIEICYDDHSASLQCNGKILRRQLSGGPITVAVWTGRVTLEEMIEEADHYLPQEVTA